MEKIRFCNPNLYQDLSGDVLAEVESVLLVLTGKEATVMKRISESEQRYGDSSRSKANRMSLKFISQVVKEKQMAVVKTYVQRRGRIVKMQKIGMREMNLQIPLGILEDKK